MLNLLKISAQTNAQTREANLSIEPLSIDKENSLQGFYEAIGCRAIDIVSTTINSADVDLIVDDEGLLQPVPEEKDGLDGFLFLDDYGNEIPLAGVVLVAAVNQDGETISATVDRHEVVRWFVTNKAHVVALPPIG